MRLLAPFHLPLFSWSYVKPLVAIRELVLNDLSPRLREYIEQAAFEEFVSPTAPSFPRLPGAFEHIGSEDNRHYQVMQLRRVRGEQPSFIVTLAELLRSHHQWPLWLDMETALSWGIQLCRMVARLHRLGVIMGDLDPTTVLVDGEGAAANSREQRSSDMMYNLLVTMARGRSATLNRVDVVFKSGGLNCAAWLYRPGGDGPQPCVILAHGFGGIREMRLDAYASCFAQAGMAALVFDYRHFGASEGEPRQLLDIKLQLADWTAAIAFARTLDGIDAERIALWGTSFSGGHIIEMAARDKRIIAAVAQVPFVDGLAIMRSDIRANIRLLVAWVKDELRRRQKKSPYYVKIVGAPGALAAITSPGAEAGMRAMVLEDSPWQDSVAGRIFLSVGFYRPVKAAPRVQCPLLICVCDRDMVTPPGPAIKAAHNAPHGELRQYSGTHFDIYVGELFEKAVADQTAFLMRCVLNEHPDMESRADF